MDDWGFRPFQETSIYANAPTKLNLEKEPWKTDLDFFLIYHDHRDSQPI